MDDWDILGNIGQLKVGGINYVVKIDFDESFLRILEEHITFETFFKSASLY